ncbi:uncharacterized protein ATNIH1004_011698 [Aspergillus tanneri]|uniref:Protein kinase domain-containing protein n=1 Tax=Aspergillus tanneri TaxID=1220188 RepID=A0A5M9M3F0_9EURO|nr:uncharacterized protein ATNIH1004_011698 [Aspergillus tanneri]KAA8641562.1 hypothetical protein ATNIH1004_011698 [Aspergillus tanneri]
MNRISLFKTPVNFEHECILQRSDENKQFLDLLQQIFQFNPTQRITAREALKYFEKRNPNFQMTTPLSMVKAQGLIWKMRTANAALLCCLQRSPRGRAAAFEDYGEVNHRDKNGQTPRFALF